MKVTLSFKTPDVVDNAIECAGVDENEREETIHKVKALAKKWVEYGEYVYLELDTETKTIKVLEVK